MADRRVLIPQVHVPGKPVGRHIFHDERSKNFRAATAPSVVSVTHRTYGLPLTQKRGSCTAEATIGSLNTVPNYRAGHVYKQADADHLYDLEIVAEGGNPKTDDPGGTGLTVCQVAKAQGLITRYEHAFGIDHALAALALRPVITGVTWYSSFDTPDADGVISLSAGAYIRGGHEILVFEIDADHELVGCENSWGKTYGKRGKFYLSFALWERLLSEHGDVTVPIYDPQG